MLESFFNKGAGLKAATLLKNVYCVKKRDSEEVLSSKFFEIFTKFFNRPCQVAASICKNLANSYL